MPTKQILFSLLMLSTAANILPRQYDESFALDISSLKNYKRSLIHIGVDGDKDNISIWYKKTDGEKSSFENESCTAEISNLLRSAEGGLLKRYLKAKYSAVYAKKSQQEIPCVFCASVAQRFSNKSEPAIIFDSTDLEDCKRLNNF